MLYLASSKTQEATPPSRISSQSSNLSATAQPFSPLNVVPNPSEDRQRIQNQSFFLSNDSHGSMASQTSHSVSRLPKLSLPSFSGDPLFWQTFWDSFNAVVWTPALSCQEYRSLTI